MRNGENCSAYEYINGDDLDFCFDLNNDQWEREFFTMLRSDQENGCDDTNPNDRGESNDNDTIPPAEPKIKTIRSAILPPAEPKIKTIRSAIQSLEEVQYFLRYHGYTSPSSLSFAIDTLADIQSKKLIETSVDDFLS